MKTLLSYQYVPRATMMISENAIVLAMIQLALDWVTPSLIMAYPTIYMKNFETINFFNVP